MICSHALNSSDKTAGCSESRDQLLPLAAIAPAAQGLQIGLFGSSALAQWNDVVDLQIDSAVAVAAAASVPNDHCSLNTVGYPVAGPAVFIAGALRRCDLDELGQFGEIENLGCTDEAFQFEAMVGEEVIHPRGQQKQT